MNNKIWIFEKWAFSNCIPQFICTTMKRQVFILYWIINPLNFWYWKKIWKIESKFVRRVPIKLPALAAPTRIRSLKSREIRLWEAVCLIQLRRRPKHHPTTRPSTSSRQATISLFSRSDPTKMWKHSRRPIRRQTKLCLPYRYQRIESRGLSSTGATRLSMNGGVRIGRRSSLVQRAETDCGGEIDKIERVSNAKHWAKKMKILRVIW